MPLILGKLDLEDLQTEKVIYKCSGYYRHEVVDNSLNILVAKTIADACPNSYKMSVTTVNFINPNCEVQYAFKPNKTALMSDSRCAAAVRKVRRSATTLAWGGLWGCEKTDLYTAVTPYYMVRVYTRAMHNMGVKKSWATRCVSNIIQLNHNLAINCEITKYGGYVWKNDNPTICTEPSLVNVTKHTFDHILKSPIRCQLIVFLLFGVLTSETKSFVPPKEQIQFVLSTLDNYCSKLERWEFEAMYQELENMFDHMVYRLLFGDYANSMPNDEIVVLIGRILKLYGSYLQQYFGTLSEFDRHSNMFACWQQLPDNRERLHKINDNLAMRLQSTTDVILTCCGSFFIQPYAYSKNRLIRGLCYIGNSMLKRGRQNMGYRIHFYHAQHAQKERYKCGLAPDLTAESTLNPYNTRCDVVIEENGTITCTCGTAGFVGLLQLGDGSDDMRHIIFNPLKMQGEYRLKYFLVFILFAGSIQTLVIQIYDPASKLYTGIYGRNKYTWSNLHLITHLLFLSACRLCITLLASQFDEDDNCAQIGPLQLSLNWTCEGMHFLHALSLFLLPRSHRPFYVIIRLILLFYCVGLVSGFITYLVFPHGFYNVQCFPQTIHLTMSIPFLCLNALSLLMLACHINLRRRSNMEEALGIAVASIPGVIAWSVMITADVPRLHPQWQFSTWYYLIMSESLILFIYHCVLKPQQLVFLITVIETIYNKHKSHHHGAIEESTEENSIHGQYPYFPQYTPRSSTRLSGPIFLRGTTSDSVTSLEFDKPDKVKQRAPRVYTRKSTRTKSVSLPRQIFGGTNRSACHEFLESISKGQRKMLVTSKAK